MINDQEARSVSMVIEAMMDAQLPIGQVVEALDEVLSPFAGKVFVMPPDGCPMCSEPVDEFNSHISIVVHANGQIPLDMPEGTKTVDVIIALTHFGCFDQNNDDDKYELIRHAGEQVELLSVGYVQTLSTTRELNGEN